MHSSIDELHIFTLNVGYAYHNADWNWQNVRSPFARLYYVTEGEAMIDIGGVIHKLTAGHLYLIPAFTKHSNICTGVFAHYYLHIYEEAATSMLDEWQYPVELPAMPTDLHLFKRMCELFPDRALPASNPTTYDNHQTLAQNLQSNLMRPLGEKMESRGIVLLLMSRFISVATPKSNVKDDRISNAINYIREHLGSRIEVGELADMSCMSKDHFTRMFRRETGETPNQYIILRKMEKAELLIVTTDMSVKSVANALGYDDSSYFNRLFRKQTGVTPQQYRESQI
jgi:AraC-like DNA-binding protein/mannose-6-phosphate isomerase-like protein (cupin superfamily)